MESIATRVPVLRSFMESSVKVSEDIFATLILLKAALLVPRGESLKA